MRPQPPGERASSEVQNSLVRLETVLTEMRSTLAAHDRRLEQIDHGSNSSAHLVREMQSNLNDMQVTLNGETRILRELLLQQSARLESVEQRLSRMEGNSDQMVGGVDERLRSMSQQVTTSVGAIVGIIAIAAILILLLR